MTQDELYEARWDSLEEFTDALLQDMNKAITKAGGNYDSFRDYLNYKEAIGIFDEAVRLAFEGVEGIITYKGVL